MTSRKSVVIMMAIVFAFICAIVGASVVFGKKKEPVLTAADATEVRVLPDDIDETLESLYGYVTNYANETATLNIIPFEMVKQVYDNYDILKESNSKMVPVMLREYAVTDTVYLDYGVDCSIVWEKSTGDVRIEPTNIEDREDYRLKQHKLSMI